MDKTSFRKFLEKFDINQENLDKILDNKEIKKIKSNYFLIDKDKVSILNENQVFTDTLIYIQLQKLLPSKYLLKLIFENTSNKCELTNQKQVDNFLFFKDLTVKATKTRNLKNGKYHIVVFENEILGICEFKKEDKYPIFNVFNLGEYLRE